MMRTSRHNALKAAGHSRMRYALWGGTTLALLTLQIYFTLAQPIDAAPDPVIDVQPGFYDHAVTATIVHPNSEAVIYYTLDGSLPTENSNLYRAPIVIDTTAVLRARAFAVAYFPSAVITRTYFIRQQYPLTVISLTTDPHNLWDRDSGIYIKGPHAETNRPFFGANYWMDWERPIHVELFEIDGSLGFSVDAGVKIFGGFTRTAPIKSLAIFLRRIYGPGSLKYQLFADRPADSYESFVLRTSSNDRNSTLFRDAALQSLLEDTDLDIQAYRPAIVFINGAYWGVHNIREKLTRHYLEDNRDADPDNVDIVEGYYRDDHRFTALEGDTALYREMLRFVESHDLTETAHYATLQTMMDIQNFIDYQVAEIYVDNRDWPGNNIKFWRPNTECGRWKWLLFDLDYGFGLRDSTHYQFNTLKFALEPQGPWYPNPPWSTFLLRSLMTNDSFRKEFINRFADRMNSAFEPARVLRRIDSMAARIEPVIAEHAERWESEGLTHWHSNVAKMRTFAEERPAYMQEFIAREFDLAGTTDIRIDVQPSGGGQVRVSSLVPQTYPWNGAYFRGVPVSYTALPAPGYKFVGWRGDTSAAERSIQSAPEGDVYNISAVFEPLPFQFSQPLITEISYAADAPWDAGDWVEIYNPNDYALNCAGYILRDQTDGHVFVWPENSIIEARGYAIVCRDPQRFRCVYPQVETVFGGWDFGLNSRAESVTLVDVFNDIVDHVAYTNSAPWPATDRAAGQTLSLAHPALDNSVVAHWETSATDGGTPGAANPLRPSVEFISLSALPHGDSQIELRWTTANEWFNAGFLIERRNGAQFDSVGFVHGALGDTNRYVFVERNLAPTSYTYRLRQRAQFGAEILSDTVHVVLQRLKNNSALNAYELDAPSPHPSSETIMLRLQVGATQRVVMSLFDLQGRFYEEWFNGTISDSKPFELNVTTRDLAGGIYLLRVEGQYFSAVQPMIIFH